MVVLPGVETLILQDPCRILIFVRIQFEGIFLTVFSESLPYSEMPLHQTSRREANLLPLQASPLGQKS